VKELGRDKGNRWGEKVAERHGRKGQECRVVNIAILKVLAILLAILF